MCHLCYVFCVILLAVYDEKIKAKIHTQFSQLPHLTLKNLCVHCFVLFCFFFHFPLRENLPSRFKFKEYCPMVFRNLRERFCIDDQDYQVRHWQRT